MYQKVSQDKKTTQQQNDLKKLQDFIKANNISDVYIAIFDKKDKKTTSYTDLSKDSLDIVAQHISKGLDSLTQSGSLDQIVSSSDDLINDINESTLESGKKTNIYLTDLLLSQSQEGSPDDILDET